MSQKRPHSPSPASSNTIDKSSWILDRSSRFIGLYSPDLSAKELRDQPDIASATHRIVAWRKPGRQRLLDSQQRDLEVGHDDDGEKFGGKALASVLTSLNVEGTVLVARWYGGVMLGPVRFDHMKKCANEAIQKWKAENENTSKRLKARDEDDRRAALIQQLPQRDESIVVLRQLLAEKRGTNSAEGQGKGSPAKISVYSTLPLTALEKLEQVRDATLSWILKEIEKIETADAEEERSNLASSADGKSLLVGTEKYDDAQDGASSGPSLAPESEISTAAIPGTEARLGLSPPSSDDNR